MHSMRWRIPGRCLAAGLIVCLWPVVGTGARAGVAKGSGEGENSAGAVVHERLPGRPFDVTPPPLGPRETAPPARPDRGGFVSVQVNVDDSGNNIIGDAANEPSIAIDPTNPQRMAIGWRQFDTINSSFRQAGYAYSTDGGQTWTFPGVLTPGTFRSDPVLDANRSGKFFYYSLKGNFLCDMFISNDQGMTWGNPIPAFGGDKAWFTIDRTTGIGSGNIYVTWSKAAGCCGDRTFTRSTDGGFSYMNPIRIPLTPTFGTLAVGPAGTLYIAGVDEPAFSNDNFVIAISDNAQDPNRTPSFQAFQVNLGGSQELGGTPNPEGLMGQVWVAVDHSGGPTNGNVYMLCSVNPPGSDPMDVHLIRSTDGGFTWSDPIRVNDDPPSSHAWQWFGTMAVAPSGRIDVIWNDTRNDNTVTFSELYYSYSTDAGLTWAPNIPVSPPFNHFLGYPQQQKLGDYYDMISDEAGANIAYAATFNGEQDVYFLDLVIDCNANGVHDGDDIASGNSQDSDGDGVPDECQCGPPGDFDCDGDVDIADFAFFSACFTGSGTPCADTCCQADLDGDGDVDIADFAIFSANFTGSQ